MLVTTLSPACAWWPRPLRWLRSAATGARHAPPCPHTHHSSLHMCGNRVRVTLHASKAGRQFGGAMQPGGVECKQEIQILSPWGRVERACDVQQKGKPTRDGVRLRAAQQSGGSILVHDHSSMIIRPRKRGLLPELHIRSEGRVPGCEAVWQRARARGCAQADQSKAPGLDRGCPPREAPGRRARRGLGVHRRSLIMTADMLSMLPRE